MHAGLHGADRHLEHLRDLVVRHVLDVGQHQGDSEFLGDRGQRRRCVAGAGDLVGMIDGRRSGLVLQFVVGHDMQHRSAPLPAQLVVAGVHRHPVQPGRERRVAPEAVELAQHGQERVLGHVGGRVGITQHAQAEGVQAMLVAPDEVGEGVGLARSEAPDELLVALDLGHGPNATHPTGRWPPSRRPGCTRRSHRAVLRPSSPRSPVA